MSNAVATRNGNGAVAVAGESDWELMERVIATGDLSQLSAQDRARYYLATCRSMGLNPMTKPFDYITLNNKLTLYATKGAGDQLRRIHGISPRVVSRELHGDIVVVTVEGTDRTGRTDSEIGAVSVANLRGEALANAWMKATTKAKRRLTLSMVGLGMLDESEVESIPSARTVRVDPETGEILDDGPPAAAGAAPRPQQPPAAARPAAAAPAAPAGNGLSTAEQRRRMTVLRRRLGWTQQDLAEEAGRYCGATNSVQMTEEQAEGFVAHLEALVREALPEPPDAPGAAQPGLIDAEFADLPGEAGDDAYTR